MSTDAQDIGVKLDNGAVATESYAYDPNYQGYVPVSWVVTPTVEEVLSHDGLLQSAMVAIANAPVKQAAQAYKELQTRAPIDPTLTEGTLIGQIVEESN